jgi:hypothetical protein
MSRPRVARRQAITDGTEGNAVGLQFLGDFRVGAIDRRQDQRVEGRYTYDLAPNEGIGRSPIDLGDLP